MGVMYDAAYPDNIPEDAEIVAGYINGLYTWTDEQWARFTKAVKIPMAIYIPGEVPPNAGKILDVETGDAQSGMALARQWADERIASGIRPTIYTSVNGLDFVGGWSDVDYWIAHPADQAHIYNYPNCVATQWYYPGGYDVSETIPSWPTEPPHPSQRLGVKYVFTDTHCNGLDQQGNGYCDIAGVDPAKFVNVVFNAADPATSGYPPYARLAGRLNVDGICRVVFEGGLPGETFDFTVVSDQ